MAGLDDLKDVLKETLNNRGVLGQVKARIRAEIFAALDDTSMPPPKLSNENLVINELIREYLAYNNYSETLSVFVPETGQPAEAAEQLNRSFLAKELQIPENENSERVPLLYGILSKHQNPMPDGGNMKGSGSQNGSIMSFSNIANHKTGPRGAQSLNLEISENTTGVQNILASGHQPVPFEFTHKT